MPEILEKMVTEPNLFKHTKITPKIHHYSKAQSTPTLFNNILNSRVVYGNVSTLPVSVRKFVEHAVALCAPEKVHICDGSEDENKLIINELKEDGTIVPLPKYDNCWLAQTNIADVARVESRTFICTDNKSEVCTPKEGVPSSLGNWISNQDYEKEVMKRFPGCMKGRCMYIIPYSMGPVGSPLSKIGIEITDSKYVVASMRIMTRMGQHVLDEITKTRCDFVKCLHSVGTPENGRISMPSWPCDPERVIILHKPKENEIISYGSGYGGNSLLGKKCFALRIGMTIGQREGWLAEHMLILGITCPNGTKKYICAAFPSACGKTNLAMMTPTLPGYKVECVGDDIAWMKFDSNGQLRAINPENGFFGVAPGTSDDTNPNAMKTIFKDTIFTNVASTSDGGVFWEGMENALNPNVTIKDWLGNAWEQGKTKSPAAHPNSRFCSPAKNCPIIDSDWENPAGVPISAIIFGGRRPEGVPLVYEAENWQHGVFIGSSMRSETTAAAEHKGKIIMNDPFAMRPFMGYNFGKYLSHWLEMEKRCDSLQGTMPKVFHVNWFRKGQDGKFLWPGYGENSRVLDWILKRIDDIECYQETPIGLIPSEGSLRLENLNTDINTKELFSIPKDFWLKEFEDIQTYFENQVGELLPSEVQNELNRLKQKMQNSN